VPRWTTHTEGGGWLGGGTEVRDCSDAQQRAITGAFDGFIDSSCLDCFPGLRDCLRRKWNEVEVDCTDPACADLDGRYSGGKVLMCNTSATRVGPVLLHELTHACDGTELDSEAVEHACFNGSGATLPFGDDTDSESDWFKFRSETSAFDGNEIERVGKYVIWNSDTGEVWTKAQEGGGWLGGGTTVKGSRCFQSDGWKHAYTPPSGGGWL
jgi:hypothetical protein